MNIENELKLIPSKGITREQVAKILRKKGITVPEEGKVIHQEDTYFDDREGTLEKAGGSFRIRRKNDKTQVTYKIPIKSNTQYKQRKEYEIVVPKEYEQNLDMELAIQLLKQEYPELTFPENIGEILTVINNRNKTNLTCPDGTILEMAFDTLQGKDGQGNIYDIRPEIEFETISGDPKNLTNVYEAVLKEFPGQTRKNALSKYARTKREISEKKLTVGEVSACAIFSEVLNSEEFDKLEYKGQVLHKHDKPVLTNLDNFKDFNYLVETIRRIKSGEYKVAIPRAVAEKEGMASLLEGENYEVKDSINLEEMMCLLLSDVKYTVASEALVDFFNTNFYGQENAITNRKNHSQQVMLLAGLIAKSSYVGATFEERLTCMITALGHDIGHVPMAHNLEAVLKDIDGIFSHEVNGKITLDNIYERADEHMLTSVQTYLPGISSEEIENSLACKATEIKSGIINHSRKGAEHREKGIVQQAARLADKIAYVFSDIRDFEQQRGIAIMDDNWAETAVLKICKGNEQLADEVKKHLEKDYIQNIKEGDYGRAAVNAINTVHCHENVGLYEVDQDAWAFVEELISRVKDVRIESGVEKDKKAMTDAAGWCINEWLCEEYKKAAGDIDLTWKNLLKRITCTGEIELLVHLSKINEDLQMKDMVDAADMEPLKPEEVKKMVQYMKVKLYDAYRAKGQTEEQARESVEQIGNDLEQLTSEDILAHFSRSFVRRLPDGGLVDSIKTRIHDMADVQLKVKPEQRDCLGNVWRILGISGDGAKRKEIKDEYYAGKRNGVLNPKIKIRVRTEGENRTLTVKVPVEKKVSERIEKSYVFTPKQEEAEFTVEQMLQKLREEHPGLNIELEGSEPIEVLEITRMEYPRMYKGYEVMFVEDSFNGRDRQEHKEIEIKCPEHPPIITKIKNTLKGRFNFIKDSKIERVLASKKRGLTHGE